ncbi:hypothetical protein B7463_g2082, partial [Scytalidium lignicola]
MKSSQPSKPGSVSGSINDGLVMAIELGGRNSANLKQPDLGSTKEHMLTSEYWVGVYETARYESRHRFDPSLQWTPSEEAKLLDIRIMLWVWIMFSSLDLIRRNINRVVSDNMLPQLHMNTNDFNNGQTIYLFSFLAAELPGGLLSKKIGPDIMTPISICIWGTICACQSLIKNRTGFYITRAILGFSQGGFIPEMVLYLSYFYKSNELPMRLSVFWTAIPLTQIIGALLAAGFFKMEGLQGMKGWQWLFLIEGLMSVVVGLITFFLLPASITETGRILKGKAKWLNGESGWFTEREEGILVNRILRDDPSKGDMNNRQHVDLKGIWTALKDVHLWPLYVLGVLAYIPYQPAANYLPLTLTTLGYSVFEANMLAVPGYFIFFILIIVWLSEKFHERLLFSAWSNIWTLPFLIALVCIPPTASPWVRYALLTGVNGIPYTHAILVGMISRNANSVGTRAVSAALYNICYQFGSIVAVNIYRNDDKPYYYRGNKILVGMSSANIVLFILTKIYYLYINRQKERKWKAMTEDQKIDYLTSTTDSGSKKLNFQCKRCQDRKIKCSRTSPCRKCVEAGVKCEFRGDGVKRSPISREYTSALESRVAMLESFLSELKSASSNERDNMIKGINLVDHLPSVNQSTQINATNDVLRPFWIKSNTGSPIYYGPASIGAVELLSSSSPHHLPRQPPMFEVSASSLHNHVIYQCLALSFRWQHFCAMIIDRDRFLTDFLLGLSAGQHCSVALVYAICALGALMATDSKVRILADRFNILAQDILMSQRFEIPSLPTLQALLCSAFFEIGKNNVSKGWMLSGMAFRMAHDLGLQRDATISSTQGEIDMSPAEVDMRRHINHPLWERWLEDQGLGYLNDPELTPSYCSVFKKHIELGKIIQDMLAQIFAPGKESSRESSRWVQLCLNQLNARFWNWHDSLPGDMRWNRWGSSFETVYPNIASMHMLYHTARISLNRPFLSTASDTGLSPASVSSDNSSQSATVCDTSVDVIVSIIQRFKNQHSLKNAPLSFVHGAISAVNIILTTSHYQQGILSTTEDTNLRTLVAALAEMSYSWSLAETARNGIQNLLSTRRCSSEESESIPAVYISNDMYDLPPEGFTVDLNQAFADGAPHFDMYSSSFEDITSSSLYFGGFEDNSYLEGSVGSTDDGTQAWAVSTNP